MAEIIPDTLNLFSPSPILLSTKEFKYERINTKTALGENVAQLEFTANADKVNFTNLKDSFLILKVKYTKADESALAANPEIGPVQNLLTSLFSNIDLFINDQRVSPNDSNIAYVNFLHLFTQTKQAKKTYLTTSMYYEDTFKSIATANQSDPQSAANTNKGLKKRASFFGGSKEVVLIGKIFIAPHNCNKLYLPMLKFDWKMQIHPQAFYSMSNHPAGTYDFHINEAAILLQRVSVSPSISLSIDSLLQRSNALYPCKHMLSRTYNIANGSFNFQFENAFVGREMPVSIHIMFIKAAAKAGSFQENPFVFYNLNLQDLTVRLGSKKIPAVDYKLNTDQNQTEFALWESYMALDYMSSNSGPGNLNRESFQNGAFIYSLDLSRDGNPNGHYMNSNFEATSLSIDGTFRERVVGTYTGRLPYFFKMYI